MFRIIPGIHWGDYAEDGQCYLMHRMQSSGWPYSKASRSSSNALSIRAGIFCLKIIVIILSCVVNVQMLVNVSMRGVPLDVPKVL